MTPKERFDIKRKIRLGEKVTKREVIDLAEDNEALSKRLALATKLIQIGIRDTEKPSILNGQMQAFLDSATKES